MVILSAHVDYARPPTPKEAKKLTGRLARLERKGQAAHVNRIRQMIPEKLTPPALTIRTGFSYLNDRIDGEASDRSAPSAEDRPPATRLMSSRGASLRFVLTLLALAQSNFKPGQIPRWSDWDWPIAGAAGERGWSDLIATDAVDSHGNVLLTARDKRARSVRSALKALESAGLVSIPHTAEGRGHPERFVLLNESGNALRETEQYRVPRQGEKTFELPRGFIDNGWVHVLEDSELAVLLMVACRFGGRSEDGMLLMPSDVRLRHYGVHRDIFSSARKTLEWFGLLKVEEQLRYSDGRAENSELRLHRLSLMEAGLEEPALPVVAEALRAQLQRV